ncbi:hypothetical protein HOU00_gp087 [Caulobacter phage CcrPW]|uniref:Cadherin domain-containing protein n=1 Tax=Caulobacter phage CcrPW TaxID=2283271 RepID=A0A385EA68_9CAUD|nr:hypothetical protein HOU00_gp087 [Caulobacter phage CcrPW]AXQ68626.1 hypothetical protein CcrPW_gp087 [Caulobacter phage CcrPW]
MAVKTTKVDLSRKMRAMPLVGLKIYGSGAGEAPPIFTTFTLDNNTVLENSPEDTLIGNFTIVPDTSVLSLFNDADGRLKIDGTSLLVGPTPISYEQTPVLDSIVRATYGPNYLDKPFPIIVVDVDEITNITITNNTILENSVQGTVVGTLATVPGGGALTLIDNAGGRFQLAGNVIQAGAVSTDYETATSHDIVVRGTIGGETLDKTITITVVNVNEGGGDIVLTGNTIAENSAQGTVVGTVSTVPTANSIALTDNAGGRFQLVSGVIQAGATATNYETATSHQITIQATYGSDTVSENFTINVTNVVELTDFTLTGTSVNENTAQGGAVGTLASTPSGATFSFVSPNNDAGGRFQIATNALQAGATATNYETAPSHLITIRATRGGETMDKNFTITVNDIDEISDIALSGNSVTENTGSGVTIGALTSTPAGATFSIVSQTPAGTYLAISGTNLVTGATPTNYEANTSHSVTIRGTRLGETFDKTFTINVTDVDEISDITLSNNSIYENSGSGTQVGTLSSTPAGATFSLVSQNPAGSYFNVVSGAIVAGSTSTDYETRTSHQVTVRGTRLSETFDKTFTINILDVDESPPAPDLDSFGLSGSSIAENSGAGTYVGTFSSSPSGASYVLNSNAGGRFAMSGNDLVAGSTPTDYETATSHSISVTATRGNTSIPQGFTINVTDVNEGGGGSQTLSPGVSNGSLTVFASNPGEQAVSGYVTVSISQGTGPWSFAWEQVSGYSGMSVAYGTVNGKPNDSGYFYLASNDRPSDRTTIWRCKVTDSIGNYGYTNNVTIRLVQSSPT